MKKNPAKSDWETWFEAMALRELDRLPTSAWESMPGFWQTLPKLDASTRRRLLVHALQLCRDRRDATPKQLVEWISREFNISKSPRDRVHDPAKMQEAAQFQARNQGASLSKIAAAVGIPGKTTTINNFAKNSQFQKWYNDEYFLLKLEQAKADMARGWCIAPTELSRRINIVIEEEDDDGCVFTKTEWHAKP
jgi:hypothetical protein